MLIDLPWNRLRIGKKAAECAKTVDRIGRSVADQSQIGH
jgi:hypothetical protein